MITIRNYKKAESLEEAWQLNQQKSNRIIGGMLWLKMGKGSIQTAIDLSGLSLDTIEETEGEFRLGCMVTLRQMEIHPGLAAYTGGAVRDALRHIVGVQFRNLATLGGSIYGRYGFSDVLTLLLSMDSYVELWQGGVVPLKEYAYRKYDRDIIVRILIRKISGKFRYLSVRNSQTDFPVLTCAAACLFGEDKDRYQAAIGARPGRAVLAEAPSELLSGGVTEEKAKEFGRFVAENVPVGSNLRGSAGYRTHLAEVLAGRAVLALETNA